MMREPAGDQWFWPTKQRHAHASSGGAALCSVLGDDPHGMDDAGQVAQQGQEDIDPELLADAHLQEDAQGRQQDSDQNAQEISHVETSMEKTNPWFVACGAPDDILGIRGAGRRRSMAAAGHRWWRHPNAWLPGRLGACAGTGVLRGHHPQDACPAW